MLSDYGVGVEECGQGFGEIAYALGDSGGFGEGVFGERGE